MRAMSTCATTYMSRQVFPQAPSPTITSFRRISAMVLCVGRVCEVCEAGQEAVARTGVLAEDGEEDVMK